jgi:hypothetical protein
MGYVIGGGKFKIYPSKMDSIIKWSVPTNFREVRSFVGGTQYLQKFIASFLAISSPLHTIKMGNKTF